MKQLKAGACFKVFFIIVKFYGNMSFFITDGAIYIFAPRSPTEIKHCVSETPALFLFVISFYCFHLNQDLMAKLGIV
jgi:hypothetical protein